MATESYALKTLLGHFEEEMRLEAKFEITEKGG